MKARFAGAYVLCVLFGFAAVVAFAGELKSGTRRPHHSINASKHQCDSVGCAQLGDPGPNGLPGVVSSVSVPQPGVVCLQGGDRTHSWQFCAVAKRT